MVNPQTDSEWTIHSLNIHGTFFEQWCADIFQSVPGCNVVSTNYPVEFPLQSNSLKSKESALDIWVELSNQDEVYAFLIECKKNNPDFVDWIFFPKRGNNSRRNLVSRIIRNQENIQSYMSALQETSLVNFFNEARESRGNYTSKKTPETQRTKTSNHAVTEASNQVAVATQAIWSEETNLAFELQRKQLTSQLKYRIKTFIPCIVTTANLYSCSFDPQDVDPSRGEINFDEVNLQKEPFIFYEYPLPRHLQPTVSDIVDIMLNGKRDIFARMDIIIINSLHLKNMLTQENAVENIINTIINTSK
ncbi:hypothetical protein Cylst_2993 [Cylindrospermum stagnale PCC 7417]|uniref:Uncharacterized protein n=1 Tax=Cylindrospermum stagnale PCC 7417 TaxID=56107 RepID=K9WZC5_9NOST|nr:hypothetical protein [Cylindrospermum stagnale]AFZ25164.1 hypothetical protein Cylst_2993 [Cylindrospermum stagnale PCC 7417]